MTELKPCPFCGASESSLSVQGGLVSCSVYCQKCKAFGPEVDSDFPNDARQKWNIAADRIEALEAENARLRKGLAPDGYVVVPKEPTAWSGSDD